MKTAFVPGVLFLSLFLAAGATGRAQTKAPPAAPVAAPAAMRELTIVVVDSLGGNQSETNNYDRIARVFTKVFEERKWPVKISFERFGAGSPPFPTEMRIYFKGIREYDPSEITFSAWVTLNDRGAKSDFGIIRSNYSPRIAEPMDDRLDQVVRGAAVLVADKVEPVLFPKTKP
jgi:hypothetical protein